MQPILPQPVGSGFPFLGKSGEELVIFYHGSLPLWEKYITNTLFTQVYNVDNTDRSLSCTISIAFMFTIVYNIIVPREEGQKKNRPTCGNRKGGPRR
jgi:hypothetical protein